MKGLNATAILLGFAGLVPFLVFGLWSVSADPASAGASARALVGYGAVILSFIGGVHWGLALASAPQAGPGEPLKLRLALSAVPVAVGLLALLGTRWISPGLGLAVLIAGFCATVVVEQGAERRGFVPPGYMGLRWLLTLIVVAVLVSVLVLRLIGAHIVL